MKIKTTTENDILSIVVEGRLDSTTAPSLEECLRNSITNDTQKLILDFSKLEYISSAGLRVLLSLQKSFCKTNKQLIITNATLDVMEVFKITGFIDILTIR